MASHTMEAWKKIELSLWVNRYSSHWMVWQLLEGWRSSKERKLSSQTSLLLVAEIVTDGL